MIKSQVTKFRYVIPIMLLYGIISLTGMFHHELFSEEAQQLTISRDSSSVFDVYKNMLYEGHVTLWNTILFLITHYISAKPVYMQLFHLLVINCAVFIFLWYAPFNLPVKTLIIFGCYFLFVYSIISRNYALGILLLFVCCVLMANPAKNMMAISILVVLMCFTHLFYVFAAIGIFAFLFYYSIGKKELYGRFAVFTGLFLFGAVCAFLQTRRIPGDSIVHVKTGLSWLNIHDLSFAIICFARGYITIPPFNQQYFWDKQYIQYLPVIIGILSAVSLFTITLVFLYKSRKALLFYLPSVALLTVFFATSGMAGSRYFGLFFIFFIAALWLAYYDGVVIFQEGNTSGIKRILPQVFIYLILINQLITGIFMYSRDYKQPFSQAKNTIIYLQANQLDKGRLVFDGYHSIPALSAYFGRKIYCLDIDQFCSFCIWKRAYNPLHPKPLIDEISSSPYADTLKEFTLVTNRGNAVTNSTIYNFKKLASFEGPVVDGEDFYIYKVTKIQR